MKKCKSCLQLKLSKEFYKHKNTRDGLFPECKECNKKRSILWQKTHPERKRELGRQDWKKHRKNRITGLKKSWDKRDFNGLRELVMKRDKFQCVKCGMTRKDHYNKWSVDLNIDHINRNRKENILENLQTICLQCHGKKDNSGNTIGKWMKKHRKFEFCIICGKPHHARGLCNSHYNKWLLARF